MPNGGQLTVTTAMHTHHGRDAATGVRGEYVRLAVADTGGGMSPAAQSRLFEPFFASEDASGSAMGLAKVDAIVKQAGGRIQVESLESLGTRENEQAFGAVRMASRDEVLAIVTRLTQTHEAGNAVPWEVSDAPADYIDQMLKLIVGIEIPIDRWVGKWKVSQNRSAPDRLGTVAGLQQRGDADGLAMAALVPTDNAKAPG